jgi:hypothetical protein
VRKIIWMMSVSVDGYMEKPNREIDRTSPPLAGAGAFLEGRVTYELTACHDSSVINL